MARIRQIGPGCFTSGTIDGIIYYVRNGKTYARSTPIVPASSYTNPAARVRQALFKMVQMHLKFHLRTIKQTISPAESGSSSNRYFKLNKNGLYTALAPLAELYVGGKEITIVDVEQAICSYAADNPNSIKIAALSGYGEVYLTGDWPNTITLNAKTGGSTMIIVVSEKGATTTITATSKTTKSPINNNVESANSNTAQTLDNNTMQTPVNNTAQTAVNQSSKTFVSHTREAPGGEVREPSTHHIAEQSATTRAGTSASSVEPQLGKIIAPTLTSINNYRGGKQVGITYASDNASFY